MAILLSSCGTKYNPALQNVQNLAPIPIIIQEAPPRIKLEVNYHDMILGCQGVEIKIKKQFKDPKQVNYGDWLNYKGKK